MGTGGNRQSKCDKFCQGSFLSLSCSVKSAKSLLSAERSQCDGHVCLLKKLLKDSVPKGWSQRELEFLPPGKVSLGQKIFRSASVSAFVWGVQCKVLSRWW